MSGTKDAYLPFWSPDSRFIGYFSHGQLRRISMEGGLSMVLCNVGFDPRGAAWGQDGTILFVPDWNHPVFRVPDRGGEPVQVTRLDPSRLELSHRWPHFLPDGNHFLYYTVSTYPELNPENPSAADRSGLYAGSLDGMEPRLVQKVRSRAVYSDGWLLFVDDGVLMARGFDPESLNLQENSVSLADGVTQSADAVWGAALFSVSDEDTLLFVRGAAENRGVSRLVLRDRKGTQIRTFGEPATYNSLRLSHDGKRAALSRSGGPTAGNSSTLI
ncbi:MAG: TolB family protein [Acidobacteriota bacterium]